MLLDCMLDPSSVGGGTVQRDVPHMAFRNVRGNDEEGIQDKKIEV